MPYSREFGSFLVLQGILTERYFNVLYVLNQQIINTFLNHKVFMVHSLQSISLIRTVVFDQKGFNLGGVDFIIISF